MEFIGSLKSADVLPYLQRVPECKCERAGSLVHRVVARNRSAGQNHTDQSLETLPVSDLFQQCSNGMERDRERQCHSVIMSAT